MKPQRRHQAVRHGNAAGAVLHEPECAVCVVVPLITRERRPEPVLDFAPDIHESGAFRRHHPLVRAADVRIAAERFHVHLDLAHRLCTVDDCERSAARRECAQLARRQQRAEPAGDVAEHHDFRAWRHRRLEQAHDRLRPARERRLQRQFVDDDAAALREQSPGRDAAAVLLVGADDLVTRRQVEAVGEEVDAHRGVLRERDVGGRRIDEPAQRAPDLEHLLVARERFTVGPFVRPGREVGLQAANAFGQGVHDFARRGAQRAGVAIGDACGNQEVPARRREHRRVVRLGLRHECRGPGKRTRGGRHTRRQTGNRKDGQEFASCAHGLTIMGTGGNICLR